MTAAEQTKPVTIVLMINPNTGDVFRVKKGEGEIYKDLLADGWKPLVLTGSKAEG